MKEIKEKLYNVKELMDKAVKLIDEDSLSSLIEVIMIKRKIGISFYNNEIQTRIVELINESILKESPFSVRLEGANSNNYSIVLEINRQIMAQIDLSKKRFYYLKNIDSELCRSRFWLINAEKKLSELNEKIDNFNNEIERDSKKIFKGNIENKKEIVIHLEKQKAYWNREIRENTERVSDKQELFNTIIHSFPTVKKDFEKLGFTIDYFNTKEQKTFQMYRKALENMSFSDSYFDEDLIIILNNHYDNNEFVRDNEIYPVHLTKTKLEHLMNYLSTIEDFKDIELNQTLNESGEQITLTFNYQDAIITINHEAQITVDKYMGGYLSNLVDFNLIQRMKELILE